MLADIDQKKCRQACTCTERLKWKQPDTHGLKTEIGNIRVFQKIRIEYFNQQETEDSRKCNHLNPQNKNDEKHW